MTPRRRMSDKERTYFFGLIFPPLWPLVIAALICDAARGVGNWFRRRR